MKNMITRLILIIIMLCFLQMPLFAAEKADDLLKSIVGKWKTIDKKTHYIKKITITEKAGVFTVHVWGNCNNKVCDWGQVQLSSQFKHGIKPWDPELNPAYLTFMKYDKDTIGVAMYNVFTKESRKKNTLIETVLKRG